MSTIRAVIVDDERLARKKIQMFAAAHDDLEIVAECSNGATAVEAIGALHPDVVFLDVRMPRMDGFAVLRQLPRHAIPRIVFVTAHGEHAIEAFEVEAIDYLLKPFDRRRFDQTLDRIRRERRAHEDTDLRRRLVDLLDRLQPAAADPKLTQFVVTAKGKIVFVDPANVHWIGAEGKYVRLHHGRIASPARSDRRARAPPRRPGVPAHPPQHDRECAQRERDLPRRRRRLRGRAARRNAAVAESKVSGAVQEFSSVRFAHRESRPSP